MWKWERLDMVVVDGGVGVDIGGRRAGCGSGSVSMVVVDGDVRKGKEGVGFPCLLCRCRLVSEIARN